MDFLNHYHPELAKYFNLLNGYYSTYISYILKTIKKYWFMLKLEMIKVKKIMKQIKTLNRVKISNYIDNLDIEIIKEILKTKFKAYYNDKDNETSLRRLLKKLFKHYYNINSISPEKSLSVINNTTSIEHI